MTKTEELTTLAIEYAVECTIWYVNGEFILTMATGEIEHCATFEEVCSIIRAYGHKEPDED